ncbi:outer membrane protein transport protein [soil metagenome]
MHSAKLTITKFLPVFLIAFGLQQTVFSQENSPYSRYGLGDLVPNANIVNRAMGGIAAGTSDYSSINFTNPASYGNLKATIFDIGFEADRRTLKSTSPSARFSSTNAVISYLQLGFPIKLKKANKKDVYWGFNIGLKPVTRINYKIATQQVLSGVGNVGTVYEGSGGLNQAYLGTGLRIKDVSFGVNGGYMFGNKNYSTQLSFLNDSIQYAQSNTATNSNFGGLFLNGGIQYQHIIKKKNKKEAIIRFGAYGNLKQTMSATKDALVETVLYDASGAKYRVDSVYENSVEGKVIYPSTLGVGVSYQTLNWLVGADFETTKWQDSRFFDEVNQVQNSWKIRVGTEYLPLKENTSFKKYFSFVRYRFGFFYGPDYIKVNNNLPEYGVTFGAGFPLKLRKGYYETQTSLLNTSVEIGSRGDKNSNLRESTLKISVGFSLSDLWFRGIKYQ